MHRVGFRTDKSSGQEYCPELVVVIGLLRGKPER